MLNIYVTYAYIFTTVNTVFTIVIIKYSRYPHAPLLTLKLAKNKALPFQLATHH